MDVPEERNALRADDVLYRRIPNVDKTDFMVEDEQTGARRPSSGAFEPDSDGVSVYIDRVLHAYGLDSRALVQAPLHGVVSIDAAQVPGEANELSVISDPWPQDVDDPTHKRNAAHALIQGLGDLGKKPRKRNQRRLAQSAVVLIDSRSGQ